MCLAMEAYADGGVLIGLRRKKALELAAKTMLVSLVFTLHEAIIGMMVSNSGGSQSVVLY